MAGYSLAHVKDHVLLRDLTALTARDRATTALLLAHIAEVDARRLYATAGYSAMYHYCIRKLGFSEDMASKRIRAARVARRFPFVFDAIADGRLHVTGVSLLSSTLRNLRAKQASSSWPRRTGPKTRSWSCSQNDSHSPMSLPESARFPDPAKKACCHYRFQAR